MLKSLSNHDAEDNDAINNKYAAMAPHVVSRTTAENVDENIEYYDISEEEYVIKPSTKAETTKTTTVCQTTITTTRKTDDIEYYDISEEDEIIKENQTPIELSSPDVTSEINIQMPCIIS